MDSKEVSLWVMENNQPVQKPLVKIVQESEKRYHVYKTLSDAKEWASLNLAYRPYQLIESYFVASRKIEKLFQQVVEKHHPDISLRQKIEEAKISFYDPEAFSCRCREDNIPEHSMAYYKPEGGLLVLLGENNSLKEVHRTIIHEFGHFIDHTLNPYRWEHTDREMRELIAIFVQEKLEEFGLYEEKYKEHYKAQKILRRLQQTNFSNRTFIQQWEFLRWIHNHQAIEFLIDNLVGEEKMVGEEKNQL